MSKIFVNTESGQNISANIISSDANNVIFLSLFGYHSVIKTFYKDINKGTSLYTNGRFFLHSVKNGYKIIQNRTYDNDIIHAIIYRNDKGSEETNNKITNYIFTELDDSFVLSNKLTAYPDELINKVYDKLYKNTPIPILKEWIPYIISNLIRSGAILKCYVEKMSGIKFSAFKISIAFNDLILIISKGLKDKNIFINENTTEISEDMKNVVGLDSYLNTFSQTLTDKIQNSFVPKFVPSKDIYSEDLNDFADYTSLRGHLNLYNAQKAAIQAASLNLDKNNVSLIIAEMGSGKTVMGIGTAIVNNKNKKKMTNIVICPGHLVEKWKYELLRLAPLSEVTIINDFDDFKNIESKINDKKRHKHLWLIISKETAKLGYDLRPAAIWSNGTGNRKLKCYVCPECGKPLFKTVYHGTGRRRYANQIFFDEKSFLRMNSYNQKCTNSISVWNNDTKEYENKICNSKLWTPAIKQKKPKWIKLGANGWIEVQHIDKLIQQISDSKEISKEDSKLLDAMYDAKTMINIQRSPRKFSIAKYINKYYKNKIDYLICDEIHQYKGGDSAQGESFGDLVRASRKTIGLTGTLLNGYASGLFHILYRTFANEMKKEGYNYNDQDKFARDYGVTRKVGFAKLNDGTQEDNHWGNVKQLPGISPIVFTKFLLENSAFVNLSDISDGLPNYTEIPLAIDMDQELANSYKNFENTIRVNIGRHYDSKKIKTMSQVLQSLSIYPDQPFDQPPIYNPENGEIIVSPDNLSSTQIRNKETVLIDLIKTKHNNGEKVLVYYHWTNRTNLNNRLNKLLTDENLKVAVLTSKVKSRERERWIKDRLNENIDVLICNPSLVETGLDLFDFTTIIYYQVGYNLFTMRQASRRSWRLGQDHDIEVYFLYYRDTVQEQALSLMANKLQAAMSIEGKFSEEGLNAMSNNEDLLTQIANSVVAGIKETVNVQVFQKSSIVSRKSINSTNSNNTIKYNYNNKSYKNYSLFTTKTLSKKKKETLCVLQKPLLNLVRYPESIVNII